MTDFELQFNLHEFIVFYMNMMIEFNAAHYICTSASNRV